MLTSDLVLVRSYKGEIRPRYIDAEDVDLLTLADDLITLFEAHRGHSRGALDEEMRELLGTGTDFLLHRGLAKLLLDRCDFETESPMEPEALREEVFALSSAQHGCGEEPFDRSEVLEQAASKLGIEVAEIERSLYGDLKDEQILRAWKPCKAQWLLHRYNTALAQGVLLRATEMEVRLGPGDDAKKHRELFRRIKFFQLLHRVKSSGDGSWTIHLDGPLSLFKASGRYGVRMASFLPTLLHLDDWKLEAKLLWGKRRQPRFFKLSPKKKLVAHGRFTGQWQPEEISWLPEQLAKLTDVWSVTTEGEIVDLGGEGVLVPDFVFEHENGTRVAMEVLGFWRKGAVESRVRLLRKHGPKNLILAISKQLAAGQEGLDEIPGEVYVFRTSPIARQVLKLLEKKIEN